MFLFGPIRLGDRSKAINAGATEFPVGRKKSSKRGKKVEERKI